MSGVAPLDLLRFIAFHLVWVLGPGILAARVLLCRRAGLLWLLVLGWGLGYALEMGAFAAAAQAGRRDLFLAWPGVAAVIALAAEPRRRRRTRSSPPRAAISRGAGVALAVIAAFLLVHVAAVNIDEIGIPSARAMRTYSPDFAWNLALAGEAKSRWPIRNPEVDARPLPYHVGWSLDAAASSLVTGIELPVVISRLQPVPLMLALVLGFALAGEAILNSRWGGPVGITIALLAGDSVGPIRGVRTGIAPFLASLTFSPSFLLGVALFIPALLLLHLALAASRSARRDLGTWVALAVVLCGCAVAKATLLPITAAALALLTVGTRVWKRCWDRRALCATALALVMLGISLATVYAGAGSTLMLRPAQGLWDPDGVHSTLVSVALALVAVPASALAGVGAALVGLRWTEWRPEPGPTMLLCVTLVSVVATFTFWDSTEDQVYFLHSGLAAGGLLAGAAVARLWSSRTTPKSRQGRVAVGVACVLGAELGLAIVSRLTDPTRAGRLTRLTLGLGARPVVLALLAAAWIVTSRRLLRRGLSGYVLPLALTTIVLAAATLQPPLVAREIKLALGSQNIAGGARLRVVGFSNGGGAPRPGAFDRIPLPGGVEAGLAWIRAHTRPSAVLVVPDVRAGLEVLNDFGYAAFSERRTLMSGTIYTSEAAAAGYENVARGRVRPFARLQRLQAAVYASCDRRALAELIRVHRASHLLIDRTSGSMLPCLTALGTVLFDDGDLAVLGLRDR